MLSRTVRGDWGRIDATNTVHAVVGGRVCGLRGIRPIASGGACQFASVHIGSDCSCADSIAQHLESGQKSCMYSDVPAVGLNAQPVASVCESKSDIAGTLTPLGQQTLCCAPQ